MQDLLRQALITISHTLGVPLRDGSIANIDHTIRTTNSNEKVLVLNTGSLIEPPEEAMLQALHSRSIGGITEHLKTLEAKGAENFMEKYYIGYGHESIGDCGTITIFIENVSMLAAKAIQDWPLYSGQESSTRYIDFSSQRFADPVDSPRSRTILQQWRSFYVQARGILQAALEERYPKHQADNNKQYSKAIKARTFDILRGFLPAGATTNLAWHSNLRQISDKLLRIRNHPLPEVRRIAHAIEDAVLEAYPSSFSDRRYPETEAYYEHVMSNNYYLEADTWPRFSLAQNMIDVGKLEQFRQILEARPAHTELPKLLNHCGRIQFEYLLDFGSFRDIQRHRPVDQRMPLVTTSHGFEDWYMTKLPSFLEGSAQKLLNQQENRIAKLSAPTEIKQYYTAMGYKLPNQLTGTLPALAYLVELRAASDVHPTLSRVAARMAQQLERWIPLHIEDNPQEFDLSRGDQDIEDTEANN